MADSQAQPVFLIQRVYLKDASLEIPNAPQIFLESEPPKVEVQIDVGESRVVEGIYEVTITSTVTTRIGEMVAFLVELKQAALFEIRNVAEEQMEPLLGIVCPNMVFPYLRANVADLITRAGFPPIHLAEISFEAFFHQRKAALAEHQAKEAASGLLGANGLPVQ